MTESCENSLEPSVPGMGALLAFLRDPASYPHQPATVHWTETHISWVFFATPFVFKVKKPVNLGFLDFSTLEKRRHFCEREVQLNRRLCPEIYLGIAPIRENARGFSFGAGGRVVEYAVKMRELPSGWFLDELLARDAVGETELTRVIERLGSFYESEKPTTQIEQWGRPEKLRISTDENFAQVQPFVGRTVSSVAFEAVRSFTNAFYEQKRHFLEERIAQGRIRDCHGDLRLDHVHITPESVTIFDCIEFNDRFRFIDIANDLAFLAMDFDFERAPRLGALFLRHAARALNDPGMLRVADFYKCYRAFVRGKVESLQEKTLDPEEHHRRASRYFQLALRYATIGSEPLVLAVMGPVASGKSTVAQALGRELDWPVFSSDRIRKTLADLPLRQRTAPELRARIYSGEMTDATYRKLLEDGLNALTKCGGVILDATFSRRAQRDPLVEACARIGTRLQVVELEASRDAIERRLRRREETATEISDARLEDFEKLRAAYEPPSEFGSSLLRVSTAGDVSATVAGVFLRMANTRASAGGQDHHQLDAPAW